MDGKGGSRASGWPRDPNPSGAVSPAFLCFSRFKQGFPEMSTNQQNGDRVPLFFVPTATGLLSLKASHPATKPYEGLGSMGCFGHSGFAVNVGTRLLQATYAVWIGGFQEAESGTFCGKGWIIPCDQYCTSILTDRLIQDVACPAPYCQCGWTNQLALARLDARRSQDTDM